MPVADLKPYRTVALRVRSSAFASQGIAMYMENAVLARLRQSCGFEQVGGAGQAPADVILDLNITKHQRGSTGFISNANQVTIETLLVLSDGQGELLGTATIRGKSSGTVINNRPQDNEAVEVIAKTIGDTLAKSGCAGPRVARAEPDPPPPPPGEGSGSQADPGQPDESRRAEAEAYNEKGKEALFRADSAGALALFQQANATVPDAKYQFNVCVALGALERTTDAIAACKQARAMNPSAKLAAKIDERLKNLQQ